MMGSGISPLTLLCLALVSAVGCIQVDIPNPTYEVARGDNITLPCTFKSAEPNPSLVIITWSVFEGEGETPVITYYTLGDSTDISGPYEGRVELDVNIATGKVNLKLFSVTLVDNKVFECRVQIPKDKTGKTADTARLVVLVAPSPPICKVEGRAEYGQNINLTCESAEGSPPPVYKWESLDVNNRPRVPDPKTTDKGGILSLYNISKDTSGYFICTSSNKIRSANCNLTLSVMPPSMLGSVGKTAGIIAAVVAVVFILIIIIYCCCCRKKNKEEEYVMGEREVEEYYDKDATQNGEKPRLVASDDERSERGTADGRKDNYEDQSERGYDRNRKENDDQHSDYDDRRSNFTDRRSDFDDRRSDFDDRRSDYSDRRDRYGDRNERYDDNPRRDDRRYDDNPRRDDRRYDDNPRRDDRRYDDNPRRDDRRYDDNPRRDDRRYDEPHDDRPPVPSNKPPRRD